ncbi:hypothetical protein EX30DRAFT_261592 [Ascodesmis nigricans]|uniref:Uncharacterized protein n=1 Tax=Ascodesmis nigricans TaxID=341454 RepID=A0A4S2MXR0_9PEZI|nr:hypothetical protein EX30DRAFT_261592 [Ascodesmis nigricans]
MSVRVAEGSASISAVLRGRQAIRQRVNIHYPLPDVTCNHKLNSSAFSATLTRKTPLPVLLPPPLCRWFFSSPQLSAQLWVEISRCCQVTSTNWVSRPAAFSSLSSQNSLPFFFPMLHCCCLMAKMTLPASSTVFPSRWSFTCADILLRSRGGTPIPSAGYPGRNTPIMMLHESSFLQGITLDPLHAQCASTRGIG